LPYKAEEESGSGEKKQKIKSEKEGRNQ